ncbi:MAG TPA: FecR family protein [Devosia sp.]
MRAAFAAVVLLLSIGSALADDWVAVKLRGAVVQFVANEWVELRRGDVVPDDRLIRTLKSGRVQLKRGRESIDLGAQTQIRIIDRTGRRFTTVQQDFGTVEIEADVRNVEHFAVRTPHLAAVVKGTKFVVTSGKSATAVTVKRGVVAVEDGHNGQSVVVVAGQTASSELGRNMQVAGRGKLPVVLDQKGRPLAVIQQQTASPEQVNGNVGGVGSTVHSATGTVGNAVGSAAGAVGGAVGAVGGAVGSTVSSTTETLGSTVGSVGGAVSGIVGGLF